VPAYVPEIPNVKDTKMEKPVLFAVTINGIIVSNIQAEWVLAVELASVINETIVQPSDKAVVQVITEYTL
jgi:hypothetical protein